MSRSSRTAPRTLALGLLMTDAEAADWFTTNAQPKRADAT
ncbi:hypothetical protein ACVWZD_006162 [Streptomyces sp. TE3672]